MPWPPASCAGCWLQRHTCTDPASVPPGRVTKNRDDARMYGTEREHITRTPEDPFFKKYAAEASR
jgi:hypothetical protein